MQRLFTMFPPGWPGLALLLLRTSVAIALLVEGYGLRHGLAGWVQGAAIVISVALCVGYLTPIATVVALVFHCLIWFDLGIDNAAVAIILSLDAMALTLLGPGAYSVDSHLFGRRLVVLPPP